MAHFNDFKIQCIPNPLETSMAMKCVEAALSYSFLTCLLDAIEGEGRVANPGVKKFP